MSVRIAPSAAFQPPERPRGGASGASEEEDTARAPMARACAGAPAAAGASDRRRERLLCRATVSLKDTFLACKSKLDMQQRLLTNPAEPVRNEGFDNEECDLILRANDILSDRRGNEFRVLKLLGKGTFGQVVLCEHTGTEERLAVKVIKNSHAYFQQARTEFQILQMLNQMFDSRNTHHIVRTKGAFMFHNHLCICFEELGIDLFELLKLNRFRGVSISTMRLFVRQLLDALSVLAEASVVHCDLKPENVLLMGGHDRLVSCKLIDFGGACFEGQKTYTYIQSRFYRSPEVLMGGEYNGAIDMWSLGCICAELFLGIPLFPGASQYDQMSRIVGMLGVPPLDLIQSSKNGRKFFKLVPTGKSRGSIALQAVLRTKEEYTADFPEELLVQPRTYFKYETLEELIMHCQETGSESDHDMMERHALIDFIKGLLILDPRERWSPLQALTHPFVTEQPFEEPFVPHASLKRRCIPLAPPVLPQSTAPVIVSPISPFSAYSPAGMVAVPQYVMTFGGFSPQVSPMGMSMGIAGFSPVSFGTPGCSFVGSQQSLSTPYPTFAAPAMAIAYSPEGPGAMAPHMLPEQFAGSALATDAMIRPEDRPEGAGGHMEWSVSGGEGGGVGQRHSHLSASSEPFYPADTQALQQQQPPPPPRGAPALHGRPPRDPHRRDSRQRSSTWHGNGPHPRRRAAFSDGTDYPSAQPSMQPMANSLAKLAPTEGHIEGSQPSGANGSAGDVRVAETIEGGPRKHSSSRGHHGRRKHRTEGHWRHKRDRAGARA